MNEHEIKVHEFMTESWMNTADDFRRPDVLANRQRRREMIRRCQNSAHAHAVKVQELQQ